MGREGEKGKNKRRTKAGTREKREGGRVRGETVVKKPRDKEKTSS